MADITLDTAADAQNGDFSACAAVIDATEKIVGRLARDHASRIATNAPSYAADLVEDFEGVGRLTVWENLGKWNGGAAFTTYMYGVISGAIADAARDIVSPGADAHALKCFARMLKIAGGDLILAERLCVTLPKPGERLSADRANAARIAFGGAVSINTPQRDGSTLEDTLAALAEDADVPSDLIEAEDIAKPRREARRALVHAVLDTMSPLRREVLRARAGFSGYPSDLDPAGVPQAVSATMHAPISYKSACDAWDKGCVNFADRFPLAVAYGRNA